MFRITKRLKLPNEGDVFAVLLRDGSFGLVQLVNVWRDDDDKVGSPTYLVFDTRASSLSKAAELASELDLARPRFGCTSDGEEIEKGLWIKLSTRPIVFPGIGSFKAQIGTWGWWKGSETGYLEMFLSAFLGLIPPYKTYDRDLARLSLDHVDLPLPMAGPKDAQQSQDGSDEALLRQIADRGDDATAVRPVLHYLLLREGQELPATIRELGSVEEADGLVCVTQNLRRAEILENVSKVRSLAEAAGAEYDGWEAELRRKKTKA